jgi:hypothetical protein
MWLIGSARASTQQVIGLAPTHITRPARRFTRKCDAAATDGSTRPLIARPCWDAPPREQMAISYACETLGRRVIGRELPHRIARLSS